MKRKTLGPDPEWFSFVREGDVVISPAGTYRVVREVSREDSGRLRALTFAIRHCSWTRRCYTVYCRTDIRQGWRHAGVRVKLTGYLDGRIAHAIRTNERPGEVSVRCCDVRGVP